MNDVTSVVALGAMNSVTTKFGVDERTKRLEYMYVCISVLMYFGMHVCAEGRMMTLEGLWNR